MKQKLYIVDAFTDKLFSGNPAAVCPLPKWLPDAVMQNIALENNLAETAFYVRDGDKYQIRWFTPTVEVDLCGHATLAAAFVLYNYEHHHENEIIFYSSRSGILKVNKQGDLLTLNFPVDVFEEVEIPPALLEGFNFVPQAGYKGKTDYMLVFENESQVSELRPDLHKVASVGGRGVIVTSKGDSADFVSRFFAPQAGIDEDPVTGSAHTTLTPYWAKKLAKNEMTAIQLSKRKGYLKCKLLNDRVEISGQAKIYLIGEIYVT